MKLTQQDQDRFWSKVDKSGGPDSCWEWQGSRSGIGGYGGFGIGRKKYRAHRIAYTLANGPIPDGLLCCHHCDNPKCVNVKHLFLGTQADNMHDCTAKGRRADMGPIGERHHSAKLTEADVRQMRMLHAAGGVTYTQLGQDFGVSRMAAGSAVAGKTWGHV